MSRQHKGGRKQQSEAPLLGPQAFMNAAHGFETSNRDCGKRTGFDKLVVTAEGSGLTNKGELSRTWGIDLSKAKKGHKLNLPVESKQEFLDVMKERATDRGAQPVAP